MKIQIYTCEILQVWPFKGLLVEDLTEKVSHKVDDFWTAKEFWLWDGGSWTPLKSTKNGQTLSLRGPKPLQSKNLDEFLKRSLRNSKFSWYCTSFRAGFVVVKLVLEYTDWAILLCFLHSRFCVALVVSFGVFPGVLEVTFLGFWMILWKILSWIFRVLSKRKD